jgi:hypothetical protein
MAATSRERQGAELGGPPAEQLTNYKSDEKWIVN